MFSITPVRLLSVAAIAVAAVAALGTSYDVNCNANLFGLSETQLKWKWKGFFVPAAKSSAESSENAENPKFNASVGKFADVEWHGTWYPATIEAVDGGFYYIHYIGYGCNWDEWVDSHRIRSIRTGVSRHYVHYTHDSNIKYQSQACQKRYDPQEFNSNCYSNCNDSPTSDVSRADRAIPAASSFSKNQNIRVEWHGTWYPATIEKVDNDKFYIHYTSYGKEWDEWVTPARMQLLK